MVASSVESEATKQPAQLEKSQSESPRLEEDDRMVRSLECKISTASSAGLLPQNEKEDAHSKDDRTTVKDLQRSLATTDDVEKIVHNVSLERTGTFSAVPPFMLPINVGQFLKFATMRMESGSDKNQNSFESNLKLFQTNFKDSSKTNDSSASSEEAGPSILHNGAQVQNFQLGRMPVIHKQTQMAQKKFKCRVCDKAFKCKHSLTEHNRVHTGEKPYQCIICLKAFAQSSTLLRHKRTHTGEKRYKCTLCDKAFTSNRMLIDHTDSHTGQKRHKCPMCTKVFAQASGLREHMNFHSGVKKYKCRICSKAFTYSRDLHKHLHLHTGIKKFKCEVCGKAFADMCYLRSHRSVHTGEKNHQCGICGKSFAHASSLTVHRRTHREDKTLEIRG